MTPPRLSAPLLLWWQLTNECDLACLHCCQESAPGRAYKDELTPEQVRRVLSEIIEARIPYAILSGGEPLLHPLFWEIVEALSEGGLDLKIETNGQSLTADVARRLSRLRIRSIQVSLDGATPRTYERMRVRGSLERALEACRRVVQGGMNLEVTYAPARFSIQEGPDLVDLAFSLGAFEFNTGRLMRVGNAVRTWRMLEPTPAQYDEFFRALAGKTREYQGRMKVSYEPSDLLEELRLRRDHPAQALHLLPTGQVKLSGPLPFICGDLRAQSLREVWEDYRRAWRTPEVQDFIDRLLENPRLLEEANRWVPLTRETIAVSSS